ncbi:MAG TPA: protoporphyrinogen oxidase [bacterium]|nr:protoporphyrinogen oxidase [bacterium]
MRAVIVGGGITGLAAASALRGHNVTLLERESRLGGKILTERIDGFLLEAGPDSFLTTKPEAVALCRTLGLGDDLVGTKSGRIVYVLSGGRLHPLPDGLMLMAPTKLFPFLRSSLFSLREKVRIATELVLPSHAHDGDESLGAFVRRRFGGAALDRLAAPLLAGIYAGDAETMSLRATFPQLLEIEHTRGSVIAGMMAQRARARSVPTAGRVPLFMTLRGGLDRLVEQLHTILGDVDVRLGKTATDLSRDRSSYVIHLQDGGDVEADLVILSTPAFVTADLIRRLVPDAAALLQQIPYASTATISLGYRERDVPTMAGDGFVVARDERHHLTACTWVSTKWPGRAPAGFVLLRAYVGSARDPNILERSDDEIVALVRAELGAAMGLSADPVLTHIVRWPRSMPQYTIGHLDRLAAVKQTLQPFPGIVLAGAGYRGIGLPDCIRQGLAAARTAVAV